jgi:hypothetical protein
MVHDDEATVRELLGPHDPVARAPEARVPLALDRLELSARPRRRRLRLRPRLAIGGLAAAAAVVLVVAAGLRGEGPRDSTFGLQRSVELLAAAEAGTTAGPALVSAAEALAPASGAGDGPVAYSRILSGSLATVGGDEPYSFWQPEEVSSWVGPDGRGLIRRIRGEALFPGRRDRERAGNGGAVPDAGSRDSLTLPRGTPSTFGDLPLDPDRLARRLRENAGADGDAGYRIFKTIQEMLLEPDLTPAATASLYRVAARLPGVSLTGEVRDQLGRRGVAIGLDTADRRKRTELILDRRTGRLLQSRELLLVAAPFVDATPPTSLSFDVVVVSARVGRVGEEPPDAPSPPAA